MLHLHTEGWVHRDLAARNCLLTKNYHVKISDFGYARFIGSMKEKGTEQKTGPIRWMAPETIFLNKDGKRHYSRESDVWMFGCVIFELFSRKPPFHWIGDTLSIANGIAEGKLNLPTPHSIPFIQNLMDKCLAFASVARPSFDWICKELKGLSAQNVPNVPPEGVNFTELATVL